MFLEKILCSFHQYSQRPAFCIDGTYYNYGDFFVRVSSIFTDINENYHDEIYGVTVHSSLNTYASVIAILLSGKTYVPIHPGYPRERIEQIIGQSGLKRILGKDSDSFLSVETIVNDRFVDRGDKPVALHHFDVTRQNAYILFTSGSTGVPKGVPITYYNLDSFCNSFLKLGYVLSENDRFLQMFDLTFDLSVMSYLIPLCLGACVYPVPDRGLKYVSVYNTISDHDITFALMVPSILSSLKSYFCEIELHSLRYSLFCGEALHDDLTQLWMKCAPNAIVENVYGPTEATIFCMACKMSATHEIPAYNGIVSIGKPMEGMAVAVVNDDDRKVGLGEKGQLCLHGDQLTPGYLDAERTKTAFISLDNNIYYKTGDIVFENNDGNFFYCGRVDHQVKIQGHRVELSEIEFHLRNILGIPNVIALFVESEATGLGQIQIAVEGVEQDITGINISLKNMLPSYMIPSSYHFVPLFPLNTNGKVDRKAIQTELFNKP